MKTITLALLLFWASTATADGFDSDTVADAFEAGINVGAVCQTIADDADTEEQTQIDFDACKVTRLKKFVAILSYIEEAQ